MHAKPHAALVPATLFVLLVSSPATADEPKKVNYKDDVSAIFQARCNACHNNDKKKGGLVLDGYATLMQGGGSGAVVEPGDPDNSRLYLLVAHEEEPSMPPNSPKIPDAEIELDQEVDRRRRPGDLRQRRRDEGKAQARLQDRPLPDRQAPGRARHALRRADRARGRRPPAQRHHRDGREPLGAPGRDRADTSRLSSTTPQNQRLTAVLPFPEGLDCHA